MQKKSPNILLQNIEACKPVQLLLLDVFLHRCALLNAIAGYRSLQASPVSFAGRLHVLAVIFSVLSLYYPFTNKCSNVQTFQLSNTKRAARSCELAAECHQHPISDGDER